MISWPFVKLAGPYILAFGAGLSAAWYAQGVRLDNERNKFAEYKTEQQRLGLIRLRKEDEANHEARKQYDAAKGRLQAEIDAHETFRRCVAAGKCGGLQPQPTGPGLRLPTGTDADGDGGGSVPPAGAGSPEVVGDCAKVQLRLNKLQARIEAQDGYNKKPGQ